MTEAGVSMFHLAHLPLFCSLSVSLRSVIHISSAGSKTSLQINENSGVVWVICPVSRCVSWLWSPPFWSLMLKSADSFPHSLMYNQSHLALNRLRHVQWFVCSVFQWLSVWLFTLLFTLPIAGRFPSHLSYRTITVAWLVSALVHIRASLRVNM